MRKTLLIFFALLAMALGGMAQDAPKREFRGAWLHLIGQSQWAAKTPAQQRDYIRDQFDKLQSAGINAVIFQIRPAADAAYISKLEPWSKFLTGKQGKAPNPLWDPLEFAIEEAHKRGMELHAWLNPYRVSTTPNEVLAENHIARKHPERFFKYDGKLLFDPAYQENRDFICEVVTDILNRYDVDAIHIDDYFYPYPVAGKSIPDDASYAKFGNGMNRGDWRRENVNKLIEQLYTTIKDVKPWVRFGISPFGIWRNKKEDPRGSQSNGFTNYDGLYADVLLWAKNGWVDYLSPQLYWELDKTVAPSRGLAKWWSENVHGVDVYIGQDLRLTMNTPDTKAGKPNELYTKIKLSRELPNTKGAIWFHGYWLTDNYKGAHDQIANNYYSTLALPPAYGDLKKKPQQVKDIKIVRDKEGKNILEWKAPGKGHHESETDVVRYVVYEFFEGEEQDITNPQTIIAITPDTAVILPGVNEGNTYAVTALDRMNRESAPIYLYNK
ncbi:MAG: family 10 glycosylhydrolase [Muribaculaceae bacterium]|nr:family 10 glycosylhydrolase [Muribaculaceae bacterium]